MTPVIGLAGRIRAGKSTAAEYLIGAHGYAQCDFADALRVAVATLNPIVGMGGERYVDAVEKYGYTTAKARFPEVRRLLQVMGTDVVRGLDPDTWVRAWLLATQGRAPVVAADVRFPNEIDAVHDSGGEVWWVDRPGCDDGDHPSECSIGPADCDRLIPNAGNISDLHDTIDVHLRLVYR